MKITRAKAEQKYKEEINSGTINTYITPYYNSFNQYCKMLNDSGFEVEE